MNKILQNTEKIPLIRIFSISVIFSFILWLCFLLTGDTNQANLFYGIKKPCDDLFMDFINPILQSENFLTYEYLFDNRMWLCYTPLVYFLFNILDKIAVNNTDPFFIKILFSSVFLIITSLLCFILNYFYLFKINKIDKILFSVAVLCSGIWIHSCERANVILAVMLCIFYFVFNCRSKNKILKEIAIFLLAIASIYKISPVVFVWLLFIQKDFKSILRFFIYLTIMLILPCLSFPQETESLFSLSENLKALSDYIIRVNILGQGKSIPNYIIMFISGQNLNIANIITTIFYMSICAFCSIALLFQKKEWKRILALSLILFFTPNGIATYTLVYFIPVLAMFFNDTEKTKGDYLYLLWFFILFNTFQVYLGFIKPFTLREFAIMAMLFQLFGESIKIFKFEYLHKWSEKQFSLLLMFINNNKQKIVLKKNIIRYLVCSVLSLIIIAGGYFIYHQNYIYDIYQAKNINEHYSFETKPTIFKSDFKADLTCIFLVKEAKALTNIFQTAEGNNGIRMDLLPNMTLSFLYKTPQQKTESFAVKNIQPYNIYKIHSVMTEKSVATILYIFSPSNNAWHQIADYTTISATDNNSVQKISANNVLFFDLKIKNGNNSNWIVILTLFLFFLPLIYAFYYNDLKRLFHFLKNKIRGKNVSKYF